MAEELIDVAGTKITVKELTVSEVREWLKNVAVANKPVSGQPSKEVDVVGVMLFDWISFDDLERMSTVTKEFLENCTPSQVKLIADKCKDLNPDFFDMRSRLTALGKKALQKD